MKRIQRTLALLLTLLMIVTLFSATALAATNYTVATLKKATWYKLRYYDNANTIYKLTLTADSIIKVNWKGNKEGEGSLYFCTDKNGTYDFRGCIDSEKATGSDTFALSKGTYYVRMYDWMQNPTTYAKITVSKAINRSNYCRAKAITLKRNQIVKIAQTNDYWYSRWYKIKLPRKKTVTITTNEDRADYIELYDAKMQRISCAYGSRKVITEDPLKSGTYYIRVNASDSYYRVSEYYGDYITFKWS